MKRKFLKLLKILVISVFTIISITGATLYFSLHEKLPEGKTGIEADNFALKIQKAVKHSQYLKTEYLQWTFRKKNHYLWNKKNNTVVVEFDDHKIYLDLKNPKKNKVLSSKKSSRKIIKKAINNFYNDSFWIVAPHKLFDQGTVRKLVTLENNTKALLVTYSSGGKTPGDSYLWKVDSNYLPISYKMWVSIIPIGGLEATWENWDSTESGAYLAQQHRLLGFGIPITNLKAWSNPRKQKG
ncbi:hypothetical protein [Aquimarina sp. I32.4]|uniref:hypothetical protein n=1 Tax=Aquimarina sp. I32.4 TaxID=2053903 RepID=UPI000CDE8BDB|nr:hypothetical protein [Aquimarina sp. I32.4]